MCSTWPCKPLSNRDWPARELAVQARRRSDIAGSKLFHVEQFRGVRQLNQTSRAKLLPGWPVQIVPRGTIVSTITSVHACLRNLLKAGDCVWEHRCRWGFAKNFCDLCHRIIAQLQRHGEGGRGRVPLRGEERARSLASGTSHLAIVLHRWEIIRKAEGLFRRGD